MRVYIVFIVMFFYLSIKGQFGELQPISEHANGYSVKFGDLDNDGDLDVVFADPQRKTVGWYENLGQGIFGEQIILTRASDGAWGLEVEDIDGNGFIDIVCASTYDEKIILLRNLGNTSFQMQVISENHFDGLDISIVDIDNDGFLDILAPSNHSYFINGVRYEKGIYWYKNTGVGGVIDTTQRLIAHARYPNAIGTIDVDNDGDKDIVYENGVLLECVWVENLGSGNFGPENILPNSGGRIRDIDVIDIDNDGYEDILTTCFNVSNVNLGRTVLYKNLGNNTFSSQILRSHRSQISSAVGDFDGDSYVDVLTEHKWLKNIGGSFTGQTFQVPNASVPSLISMSYETGDVDNDGDIDILTSTLELFINDGLGNFDVPIAIVKSPYSIIEGPVKDFDLDGTNDLIFAGEDKNSICYFENTGGEIVQAEVLLDDTVEIKQIISFNLNQDSLVDLVYIKQHRISSIYHSLSSMKNYGGGNFGNDKTIYEETSINNSESIKMIRAIDIDNDGFEDLLGINQYDVFWFKNLGDSIENNKQTLFSNTNNGLFKEVQINDLNKDGYEDILINASTYLVCYRSLGNGNFTQDFIINTNSNWIRQFCFGDLNNDSYDDIIGLSYSNGIGQIVWYKNNGGLGIDTTRNVIYEFPTSNVYTHAKIRVFDIDGDGDLDVVNSGVLWIENFGSGNFSDANFSMFDLMVDLDNDGDIDPITFDKDSGPFGDSIYWNPSYFNSPYKLKGSIFYDLNQNGEKDMNEPPLSLAQTLLTPNSLASYSNSNGDYFFSVDTNSYSINYQVDSLWSLTSDSTSYNRTLTSSLPIIGNLDFGFYPDTLITIIVPELTGGFPRCNQFVNYWLSIANEGTTNPDGFIELELDSAISYVSSSIAPDSIIGQKVYWRFDSLHFNNETRIQVEVQMPNFMSIGDNMLSKFKVNEVKNGNIVYTNVDTLSQVLVCAYDPNDKNVTPKGIGEEGYVKNNQELEYLIRFQNTGNDTAINVMVRDSLSEFLDWSSLIPIASSHNMEVRIEQNGEVVFMFENIMLPDSNVNELGSQGFVKFKINMLPNLESTTKIENRGRIYFDLNPAVVTNTVINTIYNCASFDLVMNENEFCYGEELIAATPINSFDSIAWVFNTEDTISSYNYGNTMDSSGVFLLQCIKTNALCNMDTILNIVVYPELEVNDTVINICSGDSVRFSYGFEFLEGIYYDSLSTVNNCDSVIRAIVNIDSIPEVTLTTFEKDTLCIDNNLELLPTGTPSGGVYSGVGVNATTFDPAISGAGEFEVYYVYTDSNGCTSSDTTIIIVDLCTNVNVELEEIGIKIYPNPSNGMFTIEKTRDLSGEILLKIVDSHSRIIQSDVLKDGMSEIFINIRTESIGMYYLLIEIEGSTYYKKIVKTK